MECTVLHLTLLQGIKMCPYFQSQIGANWLTVSMDTHVDKTHPKRTSCSLHQAPTFYNSFMTPRLNTV